VTVSSPQRRVDVAVPDTVPIAEILPELLERAGDGLADLGEQHGGWLLRRVDGADLAVTDTLSGAGVRDGEVLHLTEARADWPELEYDDVVETIAARAGGLGAPWTGDATRIAAIVGSGLLVALAGLAGDGGIALIGIAVALLLGGLLAGRAYDESLVGAALSAFSLPLAFVGGLHLTDDGPVGAAHVLVGGAALTVWSVAGAIVTGRGLWIFVAGAAAGGLGAAGGLAALAATPTEGAAIALVVIVVGVTSAPWLAVRLGRLPLPVVNGPSDASDPSVIQAAVDRADDMLTGMLAGLALAAVGTAWVLTDAGPAGLLLVGAAAVALALRARLYVTVRQRLPLLAGGAALFGLPLATGALHPGPATAPVLAAAAIAVAAAGARYRTRRPSPYLGRAADIVDALCLVSLVPIAAVILGLYGMMRGLSG
jgi:type VII secretion integral membrane protein EccD